MDDPAEVKKLEAETRKLDAELKDLQRPFYQRAALSATTPLLGALAVLGAAFISQNLVYERAQFVVDKARADSEKAGLISERNKLGIEVKDLTMQKNQLTAQVGGLDSERLALEQNVALDPIRAKIDEFRLDPDAFKDDYVDKIAEIINQDSNSRPARLRFVEERADGADTLIDEKFVLYLALAQADPQRKGRW